MATAAKKAGRGGARHIDRLRVNNTSSLTGISFAKRRSYGLQPYWYISVSVSLGNHPDGRKRRTSFALKDRPPEEVLVVAFAARLSAGLPVPTIAEGLAALQKFIDANPLTDQPLTANPQPGKLPGRRK